MKSVFILSVLLCAAFAAPTEEEQKPSETAVELQQEEPAGEPVPEVHFNFCPDGWFSHQSRCFRFINTPMSWYSAEEHCNSLGGHLASNISPREYNFLQQMIQAAGQSNAWLGGFNLQGRWMWIDREGFYYNNWNSQGSTSSSPCLYICSPYGWRNTACSTSHRFICSRNPFGC